MRSAERNCGKSMQISNTMIQDSVHTIESIEFVKNINYNHRIRFNFDYILQNFALQSILRLRIDYPNFLV